MIRHLSLAIPAVTLILTGSAYAQTDFSSDALFLEVVEKCIEVPDIQNDVEPAKWQWSALPNTAQKPDEQMLYAAWFDAIPALFEPGTNNSLDEALTQLLARDPATVINSGHRAIFIGQIQDDGSKIGVSINLMIDRTENEIATSLTCHIGLDGVSTINETIGNMTTDGSYVSIATPSVGMAEMSIVRLMPSALQRLTDMKPPFETIMTLQVNDTVSMVDHSDQMEDPDPNLIPLAPLPNAPENPALVPTQKSK